MPKIIVVKEVVTETAHRLYGYDGDCKNIHGHSYRWRIGVSGEINSKTGMIIDFKNLKEIIEKVVIKTFDHKLILSEGNKDFCYEGCDIEYWDVLPTVENFVNFVSDYINIFLSDKIKLEFVRCWETEKSYAEWQA